MGAELATARPKQESSKSTAAAEDRVVTRMKWMQNLEGNLVLDSVPIFVAGNLAISVARKVAALAKSRAAAAKRVRTDEWSTEMPPELLCSISDYLPLDDCMSFRSVCKAWRSAPFGLSEMANFSHDRPWLLFYGLDDKDDTCYFYSESHPKCCTLKLPDLRGATCVYSMYGCVLARRGRQFFLCYPLFMEKLELAEYPHSDVAEQVCAFEVSPASACCTVVVVSRREQSTVEISSCGVGDEEWRTEEINVDVLELGTLEFVIAEDGYIYIYTDKIVITYDTATKNWYDTQLPLYPYTDDDILFDGIRAVHQNDWLFKFGKRGISISTCSLHMMHPSNEIISASSTRVVPSGIEETGLKNVKAVWIEPPGYSRSLPGSRPSLELLCFWLFAITMYRLILRYAAARTQNVT